MRSVVLIAMLALTQQVTTASSQSNGQSGGAKASAAEHDNVRRLSERALKPAGGAEFLELADDDLVLCNAAGQITTVAQVRRGVAQGATLQGPGNNAQISELKVQLYGDTALVAGVLSAPPPAATGSSGTARAPIDARVLLVWIKHGETWKLHAMQTTMIARRPQ